MLLEEMTKVHKPSVTYEDFFVAKNKQVGICTKHINICHHFLRDTVEDKDIDI